MKILVGFGLSTLITSGLRAISLPILGWLVAPAVFAEFNLWQIILSAFTLLASLGLGHAFVRDFYNTSREDQPALMMQILLLKCLAGAVLAFAFLGLWITVLCDGCSDMVALNLPASTSAAVGFIFAAIFLQIFYTSFIQYLRLRQAALLYAVMEVGGRLLWLLVLIVVWQFGDGSLSILDLFELWIFVLFLNCVVLFVVLRSGLSACMKGRDQFFNHIWRKKIGDMFNYGKPLLLSEFLYWCLTSSGAFLLSIWHGLNTLALFAMAIAIGSLGSMFGQVFNTVWLPEVYRSFGENENLPWLTAAALKITWLTVGCVVLAGVGGFVAAALLPAHYSAIPALVMATFCKPMLMTLQRVTAIGIELQRTTWISPIFMALALGVQFGLAWWLIPRYAANGAVVSLLVSTWVFWQFKSVASARRWRSVGGAKIYIPVFVLVCISSALAIGYAS